MLTDGTLFLTQRVEEDGYFESQLSLHTGLSPILKLRAVRTINGSWAPVVRDYGSGKMVASSGQAVEHIDKCLTKALELAKQFIKISIGCY